MAPSIDPTQFEQSTNNKKDDKNNYQDPMAPPGEPGTIIADSGKDEDAPQDDFEFLGDVPLHVSAELGQIETTIKDILSLMEGSVIELDKLAGEPLEILINGRTICRGEVIVINEKYGIRMTDIVNPNEKASEFGRRSFKGH